MLLSLRAAEVVKTLAWIRRQELLSGGIAARPGEVAYPEVTGYLIPTLFDYGETAMAFRLANWLLEIQNEDGSFEDMQGTRRTFDTAACMEGLRRAHGENWITGIYHRAAERAKGWILTQLQADGSLRTVPGGETHVYTMRASWLVGNQAGAAYWKRADWWGKQAKMRTHYLGYALEGMWGMGETKFVEEQLFYAQRAVRNDGFMPFVVGRQWEDGEGTDACATAQMAILFGKVGMDTSRMVEAIGGMVDDDGGVRFGVEYTERNAWTARWVLEMWNTKGLEHE